MPDEAFKALILCGAGLAVVGVLFLLVGREIPPRRRRLAHALLCVGGLSFGVGTLIAAVREADSWSHLAVAVAIGLVTTTVVYASYIVSGAAVLRRAAVVLAALTLLGAVGLGLSLDNRDCGYPTEYGGPQC
jgi:hypothetical protein